MKYDLNAFKNAALGYTDIIRNENYTTNSNRYKFFGLNVNESSTIRFLPDLNPKNPSFFIEYHTHDMMVNGSKRTLNCLTNYGVDCPICAASAEYFVRDGKQSQIGKHLYRKLKYLAQILVIHDGVTDSDALQYKTICFGKQIYDTIIRDLNDNRMVNAPHCPENGYDYKIIHTKLNNNIDSYESSHFLLDDSKPLPDGGLFIMNKNMVDLRELRNVRYDVEMLQDILHNYKKLFDEHYKG